jgi:lysophospholipase L1-like esterase
MKFSNKTSSTPVAMNRVSIALSTGGSAIDPSTVTELQFDGITSVTMDAYASVTSDPVAFPLTPGMHLAISIHYGEVASSEDITSHVASRTDSYIVTGDQTSATDFNGAVITAHWFHIQTIDVMASDAAACVGVLGNSITDGYGLSGGLQNRWPDFFSQELLEDERTSRVGVLNLGIGATTVAGKEPTTGVSRFQDDILSQSGIRWVIIFYGVNDIGGGRSTATVINAYQELIKQARARGIKVYGATLTPFKGHGYYTEAREAVRKEVNAWIRTPDNFDACIDFDKAIRNPENPEQMRAEYSNDWLHPNVTGYELLGKSVNLNLFLE